MGRSATVLAAVQLVSAWDEGRDDGDQRKALMRAVHDLQFRRRPGVTPICAVEQGRSERQAIGAGHYLDPKVAEELVNLLKMGLSHRHIQRRLGVGKGTVGRYEKLNGPFKCPCGRERTHRGWCSERLRHSPLRQAFLAAWTGSEIVVGGKARAGARPLLCLDKTVVAKNWPYLRGAPGDSSELIAAVNDAVPRHFPDHQRADICQDLLRFWRAERPSKRSRMGPLLVSKNTIGCTQENGGRPQSTRRSPELMD